VTGIFTATLSESWLQNEIGHKFEIWGPEKTHAFKIIQMNFQFQIQTSPHMNHMKAGHSSWIWFESENRLASWKA